jgi:Putative zinc-finger
MTTDRHISMFDLDALELGALGPDERARARAHLDGCGRCRADLADTQAAGERFRAQLFPRKAAALRRPRGWLLRRLTLGAALAVAAVVLVVAVRPRRGGPELGVKGGGPAWHTFAHRGARVFAVADGDRLAPRDELRFALEPAGLPYLLVASVDGDGQVSVYYPYGGEESGRLAGEMRIELPDSIRLDGARGPERIFALLSRTALPAEPVRRALRALGGRGPDAIRSACALPVAADAQLTLLFEKESP